MNEGNNVADSSNENSAEECGKRCDRNINCNSFVFCNEQVGFATCSLKDKILVAAEEMQPKNESSNCSSYKRYLVNISKLAFLAVSVVYY